MKSRGQQGRQGLLRFRKCQEPDDVEEAVCACDEPPDKPAFAVTGDNEVFVPQQLPEDPVSSCSEREDDTRVRKKAKKATTLFSLWKPDARELGPKSTTGKSELKSAIVILKLPKKKPENNMADLASNKQKSQVLNLSDSDVSDIERPPTPPRSSDDDSWSKKEKAAKKIHPFFLKKRSEPTVEPVVASLETVEEPTGLLCEKPLIVVDESMSVRCERKANSEKAAIARLPIHPFFQSRTSKASLDTNPEAAPATDKAAALIRASLAICHVTFPDPELDCILARRPANTLRKARKLKTALPTIPHSQNVALSILLNLQSSTTSRIKPVRHVLKTQELRDLAASTVDLNHRYLQYLFNRLSVQSAFDKSDFEEQMWSAKYAPVESAQVAVCDDVALLLQKWLHARMQAERKTVKVTKSRSRRRENLAGFIEFSDEEDLVQHEPVESEEEDFEGTVHSGDTTEEDETWQPALRKSTRTMKKKRRESRLRPREHRPSKNSNVLILSGPPSSFKTASVYAAAAQLKYFVFEVNAGQRRSGKDILDQVGEMSQSHLVHSTTSTQSFLLIEDVDTVFEDDKAFWATLAKLIQTSKRPVVLTCNDTRMIPADMIALNTVLHFRPVDKSVQTDILYMTALCEGHILAKSDLSMLLETGDLRSSLAQLQFWCQMAVGDERKGLDWVLVRPREASDDFNDLRVMSEHTFTRELLWAPVSATSGISGVKESEALDIAYDLLSCSDVWAARSHTLFEVPLVSDPDEDYADPLVMKDVIIGCRVTESEIQRETEAWEYELNISHTAMEMARACLNSYCVHLE